MINIFFICKWRADLQHMPVMIHKVCELLCLDLAVPVDRVHISQATQQHWGNHKSESEAVKLS